MRAHRLNRFFYAEINNDFYKFASLADRNNFCKSQNAKPVTQKELFIKLNVKNIRELRENYSIDIGIDNNPCFYKE